MCQFVKYIRSNPLTETGPLLLWLAVVVGVCSIQADSKSDQIFDSNRLTRVEITLDAEDWRALRISHRDRRDDEGNSKFSEKPYSYYKADVTINGKLFKKVGVRKKGFVGSSISTRPSLKIAFDQFKKKQSFHGLDMMTLNNNNQDPTQSQQVLVYDFMNRVGAPAPRCGLAHVKVNGEDLGLYSNVESIRKPFIKRVLGRTGGTLYEGYAGDFTESRFERIVRKWGGDKKGKRLRELNEMFQGEKPLALGEVKKLIELKSFIRLWVAEVLVGHEDSYSGNRNNWYAYLDKKTKRFTFFPWGADWCFQVHPRYDGLEIPKSYRIRGVLCRRLWELPEVQRMYREEMMRQVSEFWDSGQMLSEVKKIIKLSRQYSTINAFWGKGVASRITDYIRHRKEEIEAELRGPFPAWPSQSSAIPSADPPLMAITGSFTTTMEGPLSGVDAAEPLTTYYTSDFFEKGTAQVTVMEQESGVARNPFKHFGVLAIPDVGWIRSEFPGLRISAGNEDESQHWDLTFILDPHRIKSGKNKLELDLFGVWAILTQGPPGADQNQMHRWTLYGNLEFDQFDLKPDSPISGSFTIEAPVFQ